mmetsp:Transcript_17376/g.26349  ORF Transcript_17376/g.26349 Transcript_17376/m.26349 type:complete len:493 (-) Transcript_17376:299-1777(-)
MEEEEVAQINEDLTLEEAAPFLHSFGVEGTTPSKERPCYGHKDKIFGIDFSPCEKYCATASEDSKVKVWCVEKNVLLATLVGHSKFHECLRVAWASSSWGNNCLDRKEDDAHLLATSGADGTVKLWSCTNPRDDWTCRTTLNHQSLLGRSEGKEESSEDYDPSESDYQVYALQFIDHWRAFGIEHPSQPKNPVLMTSSENCVHLWGLSDHPDSQKKAELENGENIDPKSILITEKMTVHFGDIDQDGYGVTACNLTESGLPTSASGPLTKKGYGGERNPNNTIFVFDACYCPANGLLGAALSDGSVRLINGRGTCITVLVLPDCQSYLTSFCWDSTGTRIATTVGTGHLITWHIDIHSNGYTEAVCMGIMEGGHEYGRPLFGAKYCGPKERCLVSWGIDGSLCLWASYLQGNIVSPISVLRHDSQYPIYAVEVSKSCVALGGGNGEGYLGVPLYLYSYSHDPQDLEPIQCTKVPESLQCIKVPEPVQCKKVE